MGGCGGGWWVVEGVGGVVVWVEGLYRGWGVVEGVGGLWRGWGEVFF